jgi:hypothetical protein
MSYEFTRQKISADRIALARRLAITVLAGCGGFALGCAANDLHSISGIFATSVAATAAGFVGLSLAR